jgi:protein-disulfide isomerase
MVFYGQTRRPVHEPIIIDSRMTPTMSDLRSAPVPPLSSTDHVRGPEGARVVVLYADFTCPRCALAVARLAGRPVRVAFRHFALRAKDRRAVPVALAAEAAAEQGRFWEMHDALYADPGRLDDPHLWARAERLGLDLDRFEADRRSAVLAERVREQVYGGIRAGVAVTPTMFVDGVAHTGPPDEAFVRRLVGPSA